MSLSELAAYVGCEYECHYGCRFIHAAPRRPVRISDTGVVQDTATSTLDNEMPIEVYCEGASCKKRRGLARMTRFYVVTPDSRTSVILSPHVHFRSNSISNGNSHLQRRSNRHTNTESTETARMACGDDGRLELDPDCFYVLRLPRVFSHKEGSAEYHQGNKGVVLGPQFCFPKAHEAIVSPSKHQQSASKHQQSAS